MDSKIINKNIAARDIYINNVEHTPAFNKYDICYIS